MTTFNQICSVLMPAYNAEKYIGKAIESILAQTYRNFELIILDDGSHDSTNNIAQSYARQDARIQVHSQRNAGVIQSLNTLVNLAGGELIFRMDADDICHPARFSKQINFMLKHPEVVAAGSRVLLIDSDGDPISDNFCEVTEHDLIDNLNLSLQPAICHPAIVARKSALVAVGLYRQEYVHAEDIDLFLRLAEVGKLANMPEILLQYRLHPESIGHTKSMHQFNSAYAAAKDALQRRRKTGSSQGVNTGEPAPPMLNQQWHHEKWAWWALKGGYITTARKHALSALRQRPLSIESAKLLFCVLRGY